MRLNRVSLPDHAASGRRNNADARHQASTWGHGPRHMILIIDDELSLANGLARLPCRDGHTVDTVAGAWR